MLQWVLWLLSSVEYHELLIFVTCSVLVWVVLPRLMSDITRRRRKLPPGPPAWPIIGHLHLLKENLHQCLYDLSKVYGPLMCLRLGSLPLIVASSPEMAKQILQTHDQIFASRSRTTAVDAVFGSQSSLGITFSNPGPYLKFLRQLCTTDLLSAKRLEGFKAIRTEEVEALLRSVLADSWNGKLVCLRPKLEAATNNIISRMVTGRHSNLAPVVVEVVEALSAVNLGEYIPFFYWMDLQGCVKRSKAAGRRLNAAFQAMIDERREQRRGKYEPPADVLDSLLLAALTCPKNIEMADEDMKALLLDLFGGASGTSALTIEWALSELLLCPKRMKILLDEVDNVVGMSRRVQESDIPNMPYLRVVIKETLRLHPVLPFLVPHKSSQPCQIYGYEIPVNSQVFVNTWAIGRDSTAWEEPLVFRPERFLDSNRDVHGQQFEYLPFGSGRRTCPGWIMGLLNVQIILASLIQAFSWSAVHELSMTEKFGILMAKAEPLVARVAPKLPTNFYEAQD